MFPSNQKVMFCFVLFLVVLIFLFMRMMMLCSERGKEYFLFCEFCDLPAYATTLKTSVSGFPYLLQLKRSFFPNVLSCDRENPSFPSSFAVRFFPEHKKHVS